MELLDWRIIIAVLALLIGLIRLFFPEQFKQMGEKIWPTSSNTQLKTNADHEKLLQTVKSVDLACPSEPLIPANFEEKHPDFKLEKINDLIEDAVENQSEGDLKKARKAYEKIEMKLLAANIHDSLGKIQLLIGNLSFEMNDPGSAKIYYIRSIESSRKTGDQETLEKAKGNLKLLDNATGH